MVSLDEFHRALLCSDIPGLNNSVILVRADSRFSPDIPGPWIFVPDLHLLSQEQGGLYQDDHEEFYHIGDAAKLNLLRFLEFLKEMKAGKDGSYGGLKVVQLGDFHDLWRERQNRKESVRQMMLRQLKENGFLFLRFRELQAERVIGNHEEELSHSGAAEENSDVWPAERLNEFLVEEAGAAGGGSILILHGHQVDSGETGLASPLNRYGARMAQYKWISRMWRDEWYYEVAPGTPDTPDPAPVLQDVVRYKPLPPIVWKDHLTYQENEERKKELAARKTQEDNQRFYIGIQELVVKDPSSKQPKPIPHHNCFWHNF